MATATPERAATVQLWEQLWAHVEHLRDENAQLRATLGLEPRRYRLVPPTVPPARLDPLVNDRGAGIRRTPAELQERRRELVAATMGP